MPVSETTGDDLVWLVRRLSVVLIAICLIGEVAALVSGNAPLGMISAAGVIFGCRGLWPRMSA